MCSYAYQMTHDKTAHCSTTCNSHKVEITQTFIKSKVDKLWYFAQWNTLQQRKYNKLFTHF